MTFNMTVSPDFTPDKISGWYIFNTWLQKRLGANIHLELFDGFESQRKAVDAGEIDIIYANPFDAAWLVREKNFLALARPCGVSDEAVVAVAEDHPAQAVEDLPEGVTVVSTDDPDIHLMGMIMLEPADLNQDNIHLSQVDNYVLVAKDLFRGNADVGFFLESAYDNLSRMVKKRLRPLVRSQIGVIRHSMLIGPGLADRRDDLLEALTGMCEHPKGPGVLQSLGIQCWEEQTQEDTEFMIDLMDTLGA